MNHIIRLFSATALLLPLLCACGGAPPNAAPVVDTDTGPGFSAADFVSRPELRSTELTTEVDEQRYRAIGEVLTEFSPSTPIIYLVGKLVKVPTGAIIEVRWMKEGILEPMFVAEVEGSDSFSFVSSFRPEGKRFIPGAYSVRIIVNDVDLGGTEFTIKGKDPLVGGPAIGNLKISTKINAKKMTPVSPAMQFKTGTPELHATFAVKNATNPVDVIIRWKREGKVFSESVVTVQGTGRFGGDVMSPTGLPDGAYAVEVDMAGSIVASQNIIVGNVAAGPSIDKVALGLALGADNMPVKERDSFAAGALTILCGLRFLDLSPDSTITLEWNRIEGESESTYHTVRTPVPNGGSGTMGAQWAPGTIDAGDYKIVVYINDAPATEKLFTVK